MAYRPMSIKLSSTEVTGDPGLMRICPSEIRKIGFMNFNRFTEL